MTFGNDDREYARPIALPDWLKEFADKELKRGTSPFEDIKNIFQNKDGQSAVEAKVQELQKLVGLDKIGKTAAKKDEEQIHDDGHNGELFEKKKARLEKLIIIANKLDEEGNFKTAAYVDKYIQRLAAEIILEKLERLPILPTEMWTDFQLTQVLNQPELFKGQEAKIEEVKKELEKRMAQKGVKPADIGKWREYGWWALWFNGDPLGFLNNASSIALIKNNVVNRFAEQGLKGLRGTSLHDIYDYIADSLVVNIGKKLGYDEALPHLNIGGDLDELLNSPNFKEERKKYLDEALSVGKMHPDFENPNPDSIIAGGMPTPENSDAAMDEWEGMVEHAEYIDDWDDILREVGEQARESYNKGKDAADKFVDRHATQEALEISGKSPKEMADDTVALSCRDGLAADDKSVFEKYPGVKKHIDNICESRQGHIDVPALLDIIRSRPERFTDKEINEIKEYAKKKVKEEKKDLGLEKDDDVIGLSETPAFVVSEEDDGNDEVFSKPSKV